MGYGMVISNNCADCRDSPGIASGRDVVTGPDRAIMVGE